MPAQKKTQTTLRARLGSRRAGAGKPGLCCRAQRQSLQDFLSLLHDAARQGVLARIQAVVESFPGRALAALMLGPQRRESTLLCPVAKAGVVVSARVSRGGVEGVTGTPGVSVCAAAFSPGPLSRPRLLL
eukprot:3302598-Amphidinium_carterae.1